MGCLKSFDVTPDPPRGSAKHLQIKKSPLGDLGVKILKGAFETDPFIYK